MSVFDSKMTRRVESFDNKQACLQEMISWLHEQKIITNRRTFLRDIKAREEIMPTGIGRGVALPHARSDAAVQLRTAVCVLGQPLDWDSLDGKPVRIVLLAAVPTDAGPGYMKFMQAVSEFCRSEDNRTALLLSENDEAMFDILTRMETDKR